jgi:hypothetical protein
MRTPDQDAVDGLRLAKGGCADVGPIALWGCGPPGTVGIFDKDITLDEAESLARVLQAWVGRRREMDREGS